MNLLTQNSKMKKTSLKNNAKIFNFSVFLHIKPNQAK